MMDKPCWSYFNELIIWGILQNGRNLSHSIRLSLPCVRYILTLLFRILKSCVIFFSWGCVNRHLPTPKRHEGATKDNILPNSRLINQWDCPVAFKSVSEGWLQEHRWLKGSKRHGQNAHLSMGSVVSLTQWCSTTQGFLHELQAAPWQNHPYHKYLPVTQLWEGLYELPEPL